MAGVDEDEDPGETTDKEEMIFVNAGVEHEIGHVTENGVNDQALERFCLAKKRNEKNGVTEIEKNLLGPDHPEVAGLKDVDHAILKRAVFFRLSEMKDPGVDPAEIQAIGREKNMVGHGAVERIKNFPTENQEQRKRDDNGGQSERNDLRFELGSSGGSALSRIAENIKTDKRRDDQRLPFNRATQRKQNEANSKVAALKKKKSGDQKGREVNIKIAQRHTVQYQSQLQRDGENESSREPVEAGCGREQED